MKKIFVAAVLTLLLTAGLAQAQSDNDIHWQESPRYGSWSFNIGLMFFSDEDFQDVYGNRGMAFYNMHAGVRLIHELELTGTIGYGFVEGRGVTPGSREKTDEWYKLHIAPGGPGLTYRFNFVLDQPVVPYIGGSALISYWMEERMEGSWKRRSYAYGGCGNAGLLILLDKLEKRASGALESEWGINNTYLFYDYRYTKLDNFDSDEYADLSSHFHSLGLLMEF